MKKRFIFLIGILIIIPALGYFYAPRKITSMITDYDPYTFDDILRYDSMRLQYGIGDHNSPEDYGFHDFVEVNVKSLHENLNLNGWYAPSAKGNKCIVLVHGRTSNRLKTMKYLELIREEGLDTLYNICIPDLRNSGKSDPAKTFMGYKFGEDLTAYLLYLHRQKKQEEFVLYGFSQGVMAILNVIGRDELSDSLENHSINIDKLVFDSSLSNVYETLWQNGQEMGLPRFFFDLVLQDFSSQINGFGDSLRLSALWNGGKIPTLFLHSKDDPTTSYQILLDELSQFDRESYRLETFDRVGHVMIYQDSAYHEEYSNIVGDFIRNN